MMKDKYLGYGYRHRNVHIDTVKHGYYEAYIIDRFYKADTLDGMRTMINHILASAGITTVKD